MANNQPLKKSYYAIIPATVRYDKGLIPNAKLLYGEITALTDEKGYCWATNDYFAKLYNVSKQSISKWINALAKNGYIKTEIIYKDGTKEILNRYITIVDYPIKENLNRGIQEKFKDNNTIENNTTNKKEIYKERDNTSQIIDDVINYLNLKTHSKYKLTTKSTRNLIKARLSEKFTLEDFKKVIDFKSNSWLGTEMEQYLRPETLFCAKHFESYLNSIPRDLPKSNNSGYKIL